MNTNSAASAPFIELSGIVGGYGRKTVLGPLDLKIERAPMTVMGPNGAGKSTLMRLLTTVRRPSAGAGNVLGLSVNSRKDVGKIRLALGYAPQDFRGINAFTVLETVQYAAWLKSMKKEDVAKASQEALLMVDLASEADKRTGHLSGGMLRRLAIAQALVHRPRMLILDEPTAGLDPMHAAEVRAVMAQLAKRTGVVLVSHLGADAAAVGGRLLLLRAGRVAFDGLVPEGVDEASRSQAVEALYQETYGRKSAA